VHAEVVKKANRVELGKYVACKHLQVEPGVRTDDDNLPIVGRPAPQLSKGSSFDQRQSAFGELQSNELAIH
jgi:hypothetical protein